MKDVDETQLIERLKELVTELFSNNIEKYLLLERSIITPSCVTSMLSEDECERVFQCTRNVSDRMKEQLLEIGSVHIPVLWRKSCILKRNLIE